MQALGKGGFNELREPSKAPMTDQNLTLKFFSTVWLSRAIDHSLGIDKGICFRLNNQNYTMGYGELREAFSVEACDPEVPFADRETNVNTFHFWKNHHQGV